MALSDIPLFRVRWWNRNGEVFDDEVTIWEGYAKMAEDVDDDYIEAEVTIISWIGIAGESG